MSFSKVYISHGKERKHESQAAVFTYKDEGDNDNIGPLRCYGLDERNSQPHISETGSLF